MGQEENKSYSREEFKKALLKGEGYDYIANHYHEMTKWELKEVLLGVYGAHTDQTQIRMREEGKYDIDESYKVADALIIQDLKNSRSFWEE